MKISNVDTSKMLAPARAKKYGIEFSTPVFINGNKEVLIQIKTNYVNWFNVYKLNKNNKWELSYGFGNKKLPKK